MRVCNGMLVICLVCLAAATSSAAPSEAKIAVSEQSALSSDALPPGSFGTSEFRGRNAFRVAQDTKGTGAKGSPSAPSKFTRPYVAPESSESTADKRENKKLVRKVRSRAFPFAYTVSTSQTVLIKKLDTKESRLVGDYWSTDESKADEKERIARMADYQIHSRLQGLGFKTIPYEDALDSGVDMKDAIVLEGDIGIITKGIDHPLITASIRVYAAQDTKKVYGAFIDGGMLGQVTGRIRTRFMKSLLDIPQ